MKASVLSSIHNLMREYRLHGYSPHFLQVNRQAIPFLQKNFHTLTLHEKIAVLLAQQTYRKALQIQVTNILQDAQATAQMSLTQKLFFLKVLAMNQFKPQSITDRQHQRYTVLIKQQLAGIPPQDLSNVALQFYTLSSLKVVSKTDLLDSLKETVKLKLNHQPQSLAIIDTALQLKLEPQLPDANCAFDIQCDILHQLITKRIPFKFELFSQVKQKLVEELSQFQLTQLPFHTLQLNRETYEELEVEDCGLENTVSVNSICTFIWCLGYCYSEENREMVKWLFDLIEQKVDSRNAYSLINCYYSLSVYGLDHKRLEERLMEVDVSRLNGKIACQLHLLKQLSGLKMSTEEQWNQWRMRKNNDQSATQQRISEAIMGLLDGRKCEANACISNFFDVDLLVDDKFIFEIDSDYHIIPCDRKNVQKGSNILRRKILEKMGYRVIALRFEDYLEVIKDEEKLKEYASRMIAEHLD